MKKEFPGFTETKGIAEEEFVYDLHARGHRNVKS
jgi:hypothetical protein